MCSIWTGLSNSGSAAGAAPLPGQPRFKALAMEDMVAGGARVLLIRAVKPRRLRVIILIIGLLKLGFVSELTHTYGTLLVFHLI